LLALQKTIKIKTYEYIFTFQFTQNVAINYEVRATGILSTAPTSLEDSLPYGTVVTQDVMARYN
jgi:primary-amine oxidase